MTRQNFVLLLLSLSIVLGCSGGGSSPTEPTGQALFRGLILDFDGDAPIGDATVTVQGRVTTSAADGSCSISDLATGATVILTRKSGYGPVDRPVTLVPGDNNLFRIHLSKVGLDP